MDKHARILVVDDDENIRNTVKAILEDEGYIVDSAANGREAIKRIGRDAVQCGALRYSTARYGRGGVAKTD